MEKMMYYSSKDLCGDEKVVARSYRTSDGFIFDKGTRFENKDPVSGLHHFFVISSTVCESEKDLSYHIKQLKKDFKNISVTEEYYR